MLLYYILLISILMLTVWLTVSYFRKENELKDLRYMCVSLQTERSECRKQLDECLKQAFRNPLRAETGGLLREIGGLIRLYKKEEDPSTWEFIYHLGDCIQYKDDIHFLRLCLFIDTRLNANTTGSVLKTFVEEYKAGKISDAKAVELCNQLLAGNSLDNALKIVTYNLNL